MSDYGVMDIRAPKGTKVVFLNKNGYDGELLFARNMLVAGVPYTVESTDVHRSSSTVELQEFPGFQFNTVMFNELDQETAKRAAADSDSKASMKLNREEFIAVFCAIYKRASGQSFMECIKDMEEAWQAYQEENNQ